jgi:tricorn protease
MSGHASVLRLGRGCMSMRVRSGVQSLSLAFVLLAAPQPGVASGDTPTLYARDPDVGASAILFVSGDDLWMVPREGGMARRVSAGPGRKRRPKLSSDGAMIAFTGGHDALYTVPAEGGEPTRVTHHPGATDLCDWTFDGRLLFMTDGFLHLFDADGKARIRQLFTVGAKGGLPERIPLPYGANGALDESGEWLAYTYYAEGRGEARGHNRGGNAPDVWLFDLRTHASRKITEWEGTDTAPMWHGRTVYYLSDAGPEGRLNLWSFDTKDGTRRQLTRYADFDVKWPSIGPGRQGEGEIVFSHAARLALLGLATGAQRDVEVRLPADSAVPAEQTFDAAKRIQTFAPAPDGSRAALEARGDVWVVGEAGVAPRNLTHSAASAERDPSWSPDGQWIAYFSDTSGEYELWITPADGSPGARQLSELGPGFRLRPVWSPDSRSIAFSDNAGAHFLTNVDSGRTIRFDIDPLARDPRFSWSHDSSWIAYARGAERSTRSSAIWLYDVAAGAARQVTSGWFSDDSPVFDRTGEILYFVSARNLWNAVIFDSVDEGNFAYPSADLVMAVPLKLGIPSPWSPRSGSSLEVRAGEHVRIDLEGFEQRGVALQGDAGDYGNLAVAADGRLICTFQPPSGATSIRITRARNAAEMETVLEKADTFELAAGGESLLARSGETLAFVAAAPSQRISHSLAVAGMTVSTNARDEWGQLFRDTWRRYRDLYYDPAMRGIDWPEMRAKYEPLLATCRSREDAYTVIADMIAELGSSHASTEPPSEEAPESVGVLCADFELRDGAYRIAKIHDGPPADTSARNPLRFPGVDVVEGEYLLAVEDKPLDVGVDPWAPFTGLGRQSVTLTVGPNPRIDAAARRVVVTPRSSENFVRNHAWVEANRVAVDRASGGRVGYVYLATTETYGASEFTRQLAGQLDKEALVVDARWNEGGFHPFHVVDVLARRRYLYFTVGRRAAGGGRVPDYLIEGPSCMLINEISLSGGDGLPYFFRKRGLGELVGARTLGGGVGVRLMPFLIDGGQLLVPEEGTYESSDAWSIEGHGVEPDIVVHETPTELAEGRDPQLEAAVRHLLDELAGRQRQPTPRPPVGR